MASSIILRDGENKIVLSNSTCARLLSIGNSWSKLRIGVRFIVNGTASISGTPVLAMGVCSGTSNPWNNGSATTTHFVGATSSNTGWNFATDTYYVNSGSVDWRPTTRIGTTVAYGSGNIHTLIMPTLLANKRGFIFLDITRGSPNFTLNGFRLNNVSAAPDATQDQFLATVAIEACTFAGHAFGTAQTIAVDEEANGAMNAVNLSWDRSITGTIEVSDVAVVRFS